MAPDFASLSMLGVLISFPPMKPQSSRPRSSARMNTMFGCCAAGAGAASKPSAASARSAAVRVMMSPRWRLLDECERDAFDIGNLLAGDVGRAQPERPG